MSSRFVFRALAKWARWFVGQSSSTGLIDRYDVEGLFPRAGSPDRSVGAGDAPPPPSAARFPSTARHPPAASSTSDPITLGRAAGTGRFRCPGCGFVVRGPEWIVRQLQRQRCRVRRPGA